MPGSTASTRRLFQYPDHQSLRSDSFLYEPSEKSSAGIYPYAAGFPEDVHRDIHPHDHHRLYCLLQLLWLGHLPGMERRHLLWYYDNVSLPLQQSDRFCQFPCRTDPIRHLTDHFRRPSHGYRGDASGRLQYGCRSPQIYERLPTIVFLLVVSHDFELYNPLLFLHKFLE